MSPFIRTYSRPPEGSKISSPRIESDFRERLDSVIRRWRLVFGCSFGLAFLVGLLLLLPSRTFTASFSFIPQSSDSRRLQFAGIAAQLGVGLPAGQPSQSPDFFVDLVNSQRIQMALADTRCPTASGKESASMAEYFGVSDQQPQKRREKVVRQLKAHISVLVQRKSGIISVGVDLKDPSVSLCTSSKILDLLQQYNTTARQSQARAERAFLEARVNEAGAELRAAEDRLQSFLLRNRDFSSSPQLAFEKARIQREVDTDQQVFASLRQSYEQSRVDEVRDTPVVSVIDPPSVSALPDPRGIVRKVFIALIAGLGVGLLLAIYWQPPSTQVSGRA